MFEDAHLTRFFSLLSLFTFFMFILVASDNFLVLFVGWEGIGICSFLLISFWQTRIAATKSALKAIVLNRLGDASFIAAVSLLFLIFKSVDFAVIFQLVPFVAHSYFSFLIFNFSYLEVISILLVIAAVGKSAQLGLHGWLPEAMEGPTPVSALIHAATLVTAGVFLIIRCSPILEYAPSTLNFILIIGGLTCVFGSTVACAQNDIKRIIAFSTTSQLGYMFFCCGLSAYNVALFHLLNHGFFKALLFLGAGAIIFSISHQQDTRKFGGLIVFLPFIYSSFLISLLALIGFPFLSGFYSKELIIELSFSAFNLNSFFIFWISSISAFLTAFYATRCLYLTFLIKNNGFKFLIQDILVIGNGIFFAFFILILGSIFSGLWFRDLLIGPGSLFFCNSILNSSNYVLFDYEYQNWFIKITPLLGTLLGVFISFFFNSFLSFCFEKSKYNHFNLIFSTSSFDFLFFKLFFKLKVFFNHKWFLDFVLNNYFAFFLLKHSYQTCYKVIDKGVLEILIINSISCSSQNLSRCSIKQQNGFIYTTICLLFISLILSFSF